MAAQEPIRRDSCPCGAQRIDAQIGLEPTPEAYVATMVGVFREVRRVLRDDGTVWLNLGDSYAGQDLGYTPSSPSNQGVSMGIVETHGPFCRICFIRNCTRHQPERYLPDCENPFKVIPPYDLDRKKPSKQSTNHSRGRHKRMPPGLKAKDLCGIPWRVAFALQQPYYAGSIRDERDRIWLAAMLDAEGCMFIHKRKAGQHNGQGYYRQNDNFGPGVEIANTSLPIIERVLKLVGKGSVCSQGPEQNGRRRQTIYRWNLRTTESREFVRELYPYLVGKQQQARILYGCPSSGERAEAAHQALMDLHRKGISDVDFAEIPSMLEPGWYLRSDIIWAKPAPMPESVTDRPTRSHEYIFLLSKSERYFYDADAIREPQESADRSDFYDPENMPAVKTPTWGIDGSQSLKMKGRAPRLLNPSGRNKRSVWTVNSEPTPEAHFATFPQKLIEPCILAGTSEKGCCAECGAPRLRVTEQNGEIARRWNGNDTPTHDDNWRQDNGRSTQRVMRTTGWRPSCAHDAPSVPCVVLDPFAGAGTTLKVAQKFGRRVVGLELSAEYIKIARNRASQTGFFFGAAPSSCDSSDTSQSDCSDDSLALAFDAPDKA